ncbi:NepR family anti-sigma factor [Algicella marina]|uniref:Transcriptional regulator n=1 Tax=Algicella marina TaxID=2683284 RepID=A0A6P1SX63_9RHOB|nr:NepR family anti-sigma factor [Algicella marina]QHQ35038.1 transcriptional regulator [Algicella marina]
MTNNKRDDERGREKVQDQIQENLRKLYDETLNEDLPPQFLQLLAKLEQEDRCK